MIKKYFALLLALLFCLTAAACAKNPEEPVKESSNNTESTSPSDTTPERVLVPDESELLPTYEGQNISVTFTDTFNSCTLMTANNTTQEEYEAYVYQFDGFSNYKKIVAPRDVLGSTGNIASIYTKETEAGTYLINLLWIPAENSIYEVGQVKATIEPLNNLDLSVFDPATAAMGSIKPLLIQVGLDGINEDGTDANTNRSGMSYVYRLSDGSFFCLDGGGGNSAGTTSKDLNCAQRLYETMKKYNAPENGEKGGEIVIAGWYISHPHVDHNGGFAAFAKNILNKPSYDVRLESVICSLPNMATQFDLGGTVEVDPEEDTSSSAKLDAFDDLLNQLRAQGVQIYKAHVGQMYYFDNMSFEILVTYDLLTPKLPDIFFSYGAYSTYKQNGQVTSNTNLTGLTNVLSIMARATVKVDEDTSYTMMWTGDSTAMNMAVANSMYGFAMKSDFLQVPHHGSPQYNNGTERTTLIQNRYHMIQINHFIGACKEAPQYQYTAERFPEYYDSDGSYGFVRAKYIMFPSSIDRTKYFDDISNEYPDQPIDQLNTSNLTDWFAIEHLQDEARAAGGDCYLARCYLTVFTLGDDVTVAKDHDVIKANMPGIVGGVIKTAEDLANMSSDLTYILANDITVIDPVGTIGPSSFSGTLDGAGHTITIQYTSNNTTFFEAGSGILFRMFSNGTVKNLTISGAKITTGTTSTQFGILAFRVYGNIVVDNVHVINATMTSGNAPGGNFGGFFGDTAADANITIRNSSFNGTIDTTFTVGGLLGRLGTNAGGTADLTVENYTISGNFIGSGYVAGLVAIVKGGDITVTNTEIKNATITASTETGLAGGVFGIAESATNATLNECKITNVTLSGATTDNWAASGTVETVNCTVGTNG